MRWTRILIVAAIAALGAGLVFLAPTRADEERSVGRGDCTFLERPEEFLEAQQARRELALDRTYKVTSLLSERRELVAPATPRNFIDTYIFAKMQRDAVAPARGSSDTEFLRRVYLDLTGRIPSADDVRAFLANNSASKRDEVINSLIGSNEFIDRWTMYFGDHLKNVANNVNVNRYAEGRNAFYWYILNSIASNKPYHSFVGEMLVATGNSWDYGPANYLLGYRQAMGPAQDIYDFMWVHVATQFLGQQTYDCIACHDGRGHLDQLNLAASRATRMESWKLAAFFSRVNIAQPAGQGNRPYNVTERATGAYNLNTTTGNRSPRQPTGGVSVVQPEYIFSGQRASNNFRESLAEFITQDPQFARATVNYIWAELMGLGIVDPPDSFDMARLDPRAPPPSPWTVQPSHPELLEALALEFINSGYDLQHIIRTIAQSTSYQLSSRYDGDWRDSYAPYFARKLVRRLDAEELHDAIVKATGVPVAYPIAGFEPIRWAMQLPDTVEGRGAGNILSVFGRGNRDNIARTSEGSILQGLTLMNDNFVVTRVRASAANSTTPNLTRRLLNAQWPDDGIVHEMYLTLLGRYPNSAEQAAALQHFQGRDRQQAVENLVWAVMNKVDFLFNY